jgi:hypothetical protein
VALESTGGAVAIARILEPYTRVVVVNTKKQHQIAEAKAKTISSTRAGWRSCWRGLPGRMLSGRADQALRRLVARRAQLVRQRSRAWNGIAARASVSGGRHSARCCFRRGVDDRVEDPLDEIGHEGRKRARVERLAG